MAAKKKHIKIKRRGEPARPACNAAGSVVYAKFPGDDDCGNCKRTVKQ